MSTHPNATKGNERKSSALAAGGLLLSGGAIVSYVLVAVCAIGLLAGGLMVGLGTTYGSKLCQVVGLIIVIASLVWAGIFGWAAIALSVAQIGSLAMNVVALRGAGKNTSAPARRSRALAITGIIASVLVLLFFASAVVTYRGQQNARHRKLDEEYILRVEEYVQSYKASRDDEWRFAPSLAAAEIHNRSSVFEMIIHMPTGHAEPDVIPPTANESDWPRYAVAIDEKSDYRYVGNDLVHSRALLAVAPRIVVLYNKTPYAGGRTVAFANHTQRFIKNADLRAVFADASAARATLGLPSITLDGPRPAPP